MYYDQASWLWLFRFPGEHQCTTDDQRRYLFNVSKVLAVCSLLITSSCVYSISFLFIPRNIPPQKISRPWEDTLMGSRGRAESGAGGEPRPRPSTRRAASTPSSCCCSTCGLNPILQMVDTFVKEAINLNLILDTWYKIIFTCYKYRTIWTGLDLG